MHCLLGPRFPKSRQAPQRPEVIGPHCVARNVSSPEDQGGLGATEVSRI